MVSYTHTHIHKQTYLPCKYYPKVQKAQFPLSPLRTHILCKRSSLTPVNSMPYVYGDIVDTRLHTTPPPISSFTDPLLPHCHTHKQIQLFLALCMPCLTIHCSRPPNFIPLPHATTPTPSHPHQSAHLSAALRAHGLTLISRRRKLAALHRLDMWRSRRTRGPTLRYSNHSRHSCQLHEMNSAECRRKLMTRTRR